MLQDFSVRGFRNFKDWYDFSLRTKKNYEFNCNSIVDGLVNDAVIYGQNGCGKSNLGLAILDITCHINDIPVMQSLTTNYLNGYMEDGGFAEFNYKFKFGSEIVEYSYGKSSPTNTIYEILKVNDAVIIEIDRRKSYKLNVRLSGTETLNRDLSSSTISAIKYIKSNSVLDLSDRNSKIFKEFTEFVSGMVFFRTLTQNADYYGQQLDTSRLSKEIIDAGKLADFEHFLNEAGVECNLGTKGEGTEERIVFKYNDSDIDFGIAASTGTMSLGIFYFWWLKLDTNKLSFAYIDEFDAYYHYSLSKLVVKKLINVNCQTILTTHNLSIMTNDLLRPDCYFILADKQYPFYELVDKDLRKAHNLEKIYKGLKYESKE
ncbi:AAA family ATPase [Psychromonas sp. Urea-02u-13]|uniref:AAA family ATPase n=1 Tax=Psychromonas sp. Urea-02u-13 TaxID=2058326 RepID=UPI000C31D36E|nr:ATP-binding protein [Psychromonas sp. Urea-02u-13]PKG37661.1 chromosome segregation protein SMC [Psychromonas sp. Urea-02u-13]